MFSDSGPGGRVAFGVTQLLAAGERLRNRIDAECRISRDLEAHPKDMNRAERWRLARRKTELALRAYHLAVTECEQAAREAAVQKVTRRGLVSRLSGVAAAIAAPGSIRRRTAA